MFSGAVIKKTKNNLGRRKGLIRLKSPQLQSTAAGSWGRNSSRSRDRKQRGEPFTGWLPTASCSTATLKQCGTTSVGWHCPPWESLSWIHRAAQTGPQVSLRESPSRVSFPRCLWSACSHWLPLSLSPRSIQRWPLDKMHIAFKLVSKRVAGERRGGNLHTALSTQTLSYYLFW